MTMQTRSPTSSTSTAYVPDDKAPWDLRRVVHLHRRAGFAGTWAELQRDLADGPQKSIDRLLTGTSRSQGVPEEFDSFAATLAENADDAGRLRAWWVYRMLFGPDPLTERLTLMWHDHFATSADKVRSLAAMRQQNETQRKLARAPFGKLLGEMMRDPALLIWLDAPSNTKGHPNENLARELMELFSMGVGHYTERDVKEAARALTGLGVAEFKFREDDARHDDGEKEILGKKGAWKAADLVRFVLEHPATADRLAWRIATTLLGEGHSADGQKELAGELARSGLDVGAAVAGVLRSRAFFAPDGLGRRVAGPVEFVIGAARALEMFDPPPSTLLLADWAGRLGQDLFYPPNVGGWKAGRHWLSPRTMIGRANFAAALLGGKLSHHGKPFDALALAKKHGRSDKPGELLSFYAELLLGGVPGPEWRDRTLDGVSAGADGARKLVVRVLSSSEMQLA